MMTRWDPESNLSPPYDLVCTRQIDQRRFGQLIGGRLHGTRDHRIGLPTFVDWRIAAQHEPALRCDGALHRLPNTPRYAVTWAAGFVRK